jgi:hypothetical protein
MDLRKKYCFNLVRKHGRLDWTANNTMSQKAAAEQKDKRVREKD